MSLEPLRLEFEKRFDMAREGNERKACTQYILHTVPAYEENLTTQTSMGYADITRMSGTLYTAVAEHTCTYTALHYPNTHTSTVDVLGTYLQVRYTSRAGGVGLIFSSATALQVKGFSGSQVLRFYGSNDMMLVLS
jgi:hypothetical protein